MRGDARVNHEANVLIGVHVRNAVITALNRVEPDSVHRSSIPDNDLYGLMHLLSQTPDLWETRTAAVIGVVCKAMRRGFSVERNVDDMQLWTMNEIHWLLTEFGAALTPEESDRLANRLRNLYACPAAPPPELGALGTMMFKMCVWHVEHTGKNAQAALKADAIRQLKSRARACDDAVTLDGQQLTTKHTLDVVENLLATLSGKGLSSLMSSIRRHLSKTILDTPDLWTTHGRM
jgi:hypothetical protein